MNISLDKINYFFKKRPLLVGGMAMQYYGLRKSGTDIDLIVAEEDFIELIKLYPSRLKDLWGDLGVCPFEFEIWKTICFFTYEDLKIGAIELNNIFVISLEKLLFMKALAMKNKKYFKDMQLIVEHIIKTQGDQYNQLITHNKKLLDKVNGISYLEKTGPVE